MKKFVKNILKNSLRNIEKTNPDIKVVIERTIFEFDNPLKIGERKRKKMENLIQRKKLEISNLKTDISSLHKMIDKINDDMEKERLHNPDSYQKLMEFGNKSIDRVNENIKKCQDEISMLTEEISALVKNKETYGVITPITESKEGEKDEFISIDN